MRTTKIALTLLMLISGNLYAADDREVAGQNGVVMVHGALIENACRLEMSSEWQDVDMGTVEVRQLEYLGAQGTPVKVQIHLRDCLRTGSNSSDLKSQTVVWSSFQPAVAVTITGEADPTNHDLMEVQGAAGFGLRIRDMRGRTLVPGERQDPHLLMPSQDALTYTIVPERTAAPLRAGYFTSRLDVQLSYD